MARNAVAFEVPSWQDAKAKEPSAFHFCYTTKHPRDESAPAASAAGICHACP